MFPDPPYIAFSAFRAGYSTYRQGGNAKGAAVQTAEHAEGRRVKTKRKNNHGA